MSTDFVTQLLQLLEGEADLTSETTWEELGRLVVKHWPLFDAQQGGLSTLRMLRECARMKLAIRLAQRKAPAQTDEDILSQYESLMQEVFAPDERADDHKEVAEDDEDA